MHIVATARGAVRGQAVHGRGDGGPVRIIAVPSAGRGVALRDGPVPRLPRAGRPVRHHGLYHCTQDQRALRGHTVYVAVGSSGAGLTHVLAGDHRSAGRGGAGPRRGPASSGDGTPCLGA